MDYCFEATSLELVHRHLSLRKPYFGIYFTLSGTITYSLNLILYSKSIEASDLDHKLISEMLTEVLNLVRSRVIFS